METSTGKSVMRLFDFHVVSGHQSRICLLWTRQDGVRSDIIIYIGTWKLDDRRETSDLHLAFALSVLASEFGSRRDRNEP